MKTIIDKDLEQVKLKCCMWTRKAVQEYVLRKNRISMPLSTLGYYLKRRGFSVQRPTKRANKQEEGRAQDWKGRE